MIKSITVTNPSGESVELELRFPEKSGFLLRRAIGLGPNVATINTTELSTKDGSQYNSSRVTSRNIVLTVRLMANPTIEDSRQTAYRFFPIGKRVDIQVETDNRVSETYGYIESNDVDLFSKEEQLTISIICPNAYFLGTTKTKTVLSGVEGLFEFPFSNESLTESLIEMSQIVLATEKTVVYEGNADTGVVIYIHALGEAENIYIYNAQTRESMTIDTDKLATLTGSGVIAGDDFTISTVKGDKYVSLQRAGLTYNILNCLDKSPDWFQLQTGDNIFGYLVDSGAGNLQFTIEHQTLYEGV